MSKYDQPADDSTYQAQTQGPQDYCPTCRGPLPQCQCSTAADEGPYFVECDKEGCERCGAERTWTVMTPPDGETALGESWVSRDDAEHVAELLNEAFQEGMKAERTNWKS